MALPTSEFLIDILEGKDGHCPCCGRYAKLYRRKLNSSMARFLVWLGRVSGDGAPWVDLADNCRAMLDNGVVITGGDHGKLAHWGLVEQRPVEDVTTTGKTSGQWRITPKGKAFLRGEIEVPRYAHLLFNDLVGWGSERTDIHQALGEVFDYEEMMTS